MPQEIPETLPQDEIKPPPVVDVGEQEATLDTKKYKAGDYDEAIELYTIAIAKCEQQQPLDARNLKIM